MGSGDASQGRGSENRLCSLAISCRRLASEVHRLARKLDAAGEKTLQDVERHLQSATDLLGTGLVSAILPTCPDPDGIVELTQLMLRSPAAAGAAARTAAGAAVGQPPSAQHRLVLHARAELVPPPDLITFLCSTQQTGILRVHTASEDFSIELDGGDIVHAHSDGAPAGERLGDILVEQGVLTPDALQQLLARGTRSPFGRRVIEEKLASRDDLLAALETQIRRLFHRLFTATPREFQFWAGPCLLAEQSMRLNANMLLLEGARAADELQRGRP